jgi:hypothetical protein
MGSDRIKQARESNPGPLGQLGQFFYFKTGPTKVNLIQFKKSELP